MWLIKKCIKKGDYFYALVPEHPKATKNGYVLYHRAVMENYLNRLLTDEEEVHHLNKDTHDNRPENLQVLSAESHRKLHNDYRTRSFAELTCSRCGKVFQREVRQLHKGYKNCYCSRKCYYSK